MGWEAIVAADPDVIVLVDAPWNTAAAKIAHLEENPATAALPAVQQQRYVIVDFPSTEAGVRNVDAVASVVDQLASLGY
jgi:iron complex transport system substrate-binding protein